MRSIAGAIVGLSPPSISVKGQISPKAPQAKEQKTKHRTAKKRSILVHCRFCQLIVKAAVNGGCAMVPMRYQKSRIQALCLRANNLGFGAENFRRLNKEQ